jgi:hypothetical protein
VNLGFSLLATGVGSFNLSWNVEIKSPSYALLPVDCLLGSYSAVLRDCLPNRVSASVVGSIISLPNIGLLCRISPLCFSLTNTATTNTTQLPMIAVLHIYLAFTETGPTENGCLSLLMSFTNDIVVPSDLGWASARIRRLSGFIDLGKTAYSWPTLRTFGL